MARISETLTKSLPEQQANATRILDLMVSKVKGTIKEKVIQAAEDLERIGIPVNSICQMITKRAEEMKVSEPYVRECLPSKYKDQAQRNVRLGLNHEGEDTSSPAVTDKKKEVRVTKKGQIKLLREEVKVLRKENEDLKNSGVLQVPQHQQQHQQPQAQPQKQVKEPEKKSESKQEEDKEIARLKEIIKTKEYELSGVIDQLRQIYGWLRNVKYLHNITYQQIGEYVRNGSDGSLKDIDVTFEKLEKAGNKIDVEIYAREKAELKAKKARGEEIVQVCQFGGLGGRPCGKQLEAEVNLGKRKESWTQYCAEHAEEILKRNYSGMTKKEQQARIRKVGRLERESKQQVTLSE